MKEDYELPVDNRYEFGSVGFHTWSDAQSLCQAKGEGWDLAIIDDYKGNYYWFQSNFICIYHSVSLNVTLIHSPE